jgi:hypothetical protein
MYSVDREIICGYIDEKIMGILGFYMCCIPGFDTTFK